MKRLISILLCAVLLFTCGCTTARREGTEPRIVCSAFVAYDFVHELAANAPIDLILLSDNGADPHSFQPSTQDLIDLHRADLFVYLGGESEAWAEDAAKSAEHDDGIRTLCLSDTVTLYEEADEEDHDHGNTPAYDEHFWLSIGNARAACTAIADALCAVDPQHETVYRDNLAAYDARLVKLGQEFAAMRAQSDCTAILVADRFPFLYLQKELSLTVCAAFSGCSAETEASFSVVTRLADFLSERELPAVLVTESSDGALARTVCETAERQVPVLTLYSLQSVTKDELASGASYLSLMQKNLEVLRKALNYNDTM